MRFRYKGYYCEPEMPLLNGGSLKKVNILPNGLSGLLTRIGSAYTVSSTAGLL